ncbi:MAG: 5-formyltetrahydrofolate cyclo-ligase [Verrucomicrobiales bacterium]|nr:5-formyltetrahydrofolate cyclo-ligase [Verrucomicrobiales bacterium]
MNPDVSELKKNLRAELRARIQLISPESRKARSEMVCTRLLQQSIWRESKAILLYAPLPDEVDIRPLFREARIKGKTVILPRFDTVTGCYTMCEVNDFERDLVRAKFGILEPAEHCPPFLSKHLDFALVPGVGFNPLGARLGRGRGFYDRLLAQVSGMKCGVAFNEQILPHIPTAPHDVRMNFVLTPERWLDASSSEVA